MYIIHVHDIVHLHVHVYTCMVTSCNTLSSLRKDHEATLLLYTLCTLYRLGLGLRVGNIRAINGLVNYYYTIAKES